MCTRCRAGHQVRKRGITQPWPLLGDQPGGWAARTADAEPLAKAAPVRRGPRPAAVPASSRSMQTCENIHRARAGNRHAHAGRRTEELRCTQGTRQPVRAHGSDSLGGALPHPGRGDEAGRKRNLLWTQPRKFSTHRADHGGRGKCPEGVRGRLLGCSRDALFLDLLVSNTRVIKLHIYASDLYLFPLASTSIASAFTRFEKLRLRC